MRISDTENYLVNPYTAIKLFAKTYLAYGQIVLSGRKYKLTREAWIAAMFLIAVMNKYGSNWWLTPISDESGSPDFNCFSLVMSDTKLGAEKQQMKLEVFEWRKSVPDEEFISALQRIKLNKIIDPSITLVCYIRDGGYISPATELNTKLKEIQPKVKDIWYLGDVSQDARIWRVTQVYPNLVAIDIDYDQILIKKEGYSFIHTYRGSSDQLIYEHTDQQLLLTPEFELQTVDK